MNNKLLLFPSLVLVIILVVVSASADAIPVPWQTCGWPFMSAGGPLFSPEQTQFAQRTLAGYLRDATFPCDGFYGPETASLVKKFQMRLQIMPVDGALGPETWARLASVATSPPLRFGQKNDLRIDALQGGLNYQGFAVPMSGQFDDETVAALRQFQQARGDSTTNGQTATVQTWQLLLTGCNSSRNAFFDAGWPQGVLSIETLRCLRNTAQMRWAVFECWVEEGSTGKFFSECVQNINNARAAGFDGKSLPGAYLFLQRYYVDSAQQIRWFLANMSRNGMAYGQNYSSVMFDIEGSKWGQYTQAENREFLLAARAELKARGVTNVIIYCGREWPAFFGAGNATFDNVFANDGLIMAHYDRIASLDGQLFPPYGPWNQQNFVGKQFWDGSQGVTMCGPELDWDIARGDNPFWNNF